MNLNITLRRSMRFAVGAMALAHASTALGGTFGPTLLVNTEAYAVIEDQDSSANVILKFGDTLAKTLTYNRNLNRFEFSDTLAVTGSVRATGTVSGSLIYGQTYEGGGLSDCDNATASKLLWDTTTKRFSCGSDQSGASSGMSQADADLRYVNQSGDTMTGALRVQVTGGDSSTLGLRVTNTASGSHLHAEERLTSSGALTVEGNLTFGDAIGDAITVNAGSWSFQNAVNFAVTNAVNALSIDTNTLSIDALNNRIGIRTESPENPLEVVGTISGTVLQTTGNIVSSGSLIVESELTTGALRGAGLSDCDTGATSKLLWDATTGTFSCGADQTGAGGGLTQGDADLRYVNRAGSSMTGTLIINVPGIDSVGLEVVDTASGATIHAQNQLRSSGSLIIEGASTLQSTLTLRPSATQAITAVSNTILANSTMVVVDPNADYTLTSAPTIANGIVGQMLIITVANSETNKLVLLDQDTLASSNLQLGSSTREISAAETLTLLFDGTDWVEQAYTTESADIRTYTSVGSNTWTKPNGAKAIYVECVGGGGGGGGGTGAAAGTARIGGGGGGGGARGQRWLLPVDVTATVTATVGAGGNGGTTGANGTAGGNSSFGTYLTCFAGGFGKGGIAATVSAGGGGGGTAGVGANGAAATNLGGSPAATAGANGISGQGGGGNIGAAAGNAEFGGGGGNGSSAVPAAAGAGGSSIYGAGGGGGGGGLTTANATTTSGAGGNVGVFTNGGGAAGGNSSATCTNGTAGTAGNSTKNGTGGGGGGSDTDSVGCTGGAGGALGGGGGGGGGGLTTGGAGGAGGRGEVRVYTFY